jgi:hypothetical protein
MMMFNPNEVVKFKAGDSWRQGTVIRCNGTNVEIQVYSEVEIAPVEDVRRFIPIDPDAVIRFGKEQLPILLECLERGSKVFSQPTEFKVENLDGEDLQVLFDSLSIDLVTMDQPCIGCFREKPAWQVTLWCHHPGSRWEPPFSDDSPQGTYLSTPQAAQEALTLLGRIMISCEFERMTDEAQAKELEQFGD